ncbi:MAG: bifunctional glutamate N-acetyltransferase/amino-acid acetyltransferase ArgJ [Christensenellales bacterium]
MKNIEKINGGVCGPKGFLAGGVHCGIRKNQQKKDLAVILSKVDCAAAAVYTQNKVYGAPITVTRQNISDGRAKAVICNSGNANTCNADGIEKAQAMCDMTAKAFGIAPGDIIVASTGVIGQSLDISPIEKGIEMLKGNLSDGGATDAAMAIMTTDLSPKEIALSRQIGGKTVKLGAMAKGSGMIHPNMATMLCFITSDVNIAPKMLQKALSQVAGDTFNMISVDGDTSTNDMVSIMASGLAENPLIENEGEDFEAFKEMLFEASKALSMMIAADGEGATKLLECAVNNAPSKQLAVDISKSVITSSLVKTAMFGQDANWGRILCAIGYTPGDFAVDKISVALSSEGGKVDVCKNGAGVPFSEEKAADVLAAKEIRIDIDMGQGEGSATAWGCDLTYDYVKINGDYRT